MVLLRNKYGGWFEIPDDKIDPKRLPTYANSDTRERQLKQNAEEAKRLNATSRRENVEKHADRLIAKAHEVEPQVTKDLQEVVKSDNAKLAGLDFRFKGKDSLSDKLERKAEEKGITVEQYANRVTDVLRYTEMSTEENLYSNFKSFVDKMSARGYTMTEVNNTWYDGSVYKGINTLMRTKDGYTFEMQFHTQTSLEIKEINHKLYEDSRALGTPQSVKDAAELQMKQNAIRVPSPVDIDKIKSF